MMKSGTAKVREMLLNCLTAYRDGFLPLGSPERMVYQYDATWHCERESDQWRDCPEGTEQDIEKRMERYDLLMMGGEQYRNCLAGETEAAEAAKGIEWCRSCKAKKWLEDNLEVPA